MRPLQRSAGNSFIIVLLLLILSLIIVNTVIDIGKQPLQNVKHGQSIFQRMINNAAEVRPEYISHQLLAIDSDNPKLVWKQTETGSRIKVSVWMNSANYNKYYKQLIGNPEGSYSPEKVPTIWVTLVPQVQEFCRNQVASAIAPANFDPSFRLKQYLGLDPARPYGYFIELWVKADDLFRPCPDPQTDDHVCELALAKQNPPRVKNVADYTEFFQQLKSNSYVSGGAPWTRLGYTFDWQNGQRNVGASEYMLVPKAHYFVAAGYTTAEYCAAK